MSVQETFKQCLRVYIKIVFNTDKETSWIYGKRSSIFELLIPLKKQLVQANKKTNSSVDKMCTRYFSPKDKLD